MVKWTLIGQVKGANLSPSPWVDCISREVTVGADIEGIEPLSFECRYVKRSFEDSIVVVIPIIGIGDAIVVVIEWICSVTTIETLQQVVNTIVVIVEIVQVADTIVIVVITV